MALHTLGTKGTAQLACLAGFATTLLPVDFAAIANSIVDDAGFSPPVYVVATATTAGTTALTAMASVAGPPLSQIRPNDFVIGAAADIVPGTYVVAASGTTATLSQAAVSTGTLKNLVFVRSSANLTNLTPDMDKSGLLFVPKRGVLKLLPGDVVARDSSGWPILLSAAAISWAGSDWTYT